MCFPEIDAVRRDDVSFRNRVQLPHHKNERSLLETLEIDMISSFPTSDPLHLLDLGIMKKCLTRWVHGEKHYGRKWSPAAIASVTKRLLKCQDQMPTDIHRAVRGVNCLSHWKGVEFRTFLLYIGMLILKSVVPKKEYEHFLNICCAVTICSCEFHKNYIEVAKDMFEAYIEDYIEIYGRHLISSNVHNLAHITEDLVNQNVGSLMDISTYKYENALRMLGLKIKNCNLPLEQVARRSIELSKTQLKNSIDLFDDSVFMPKLQYEIPNQCHGINKTYSKIQITPDIMLSNRKFGDRWFLTHLNEIVVMNYALKIGDHFKICGSRIKEKRNFFTYPLHSGALCIYMSDGRTEDHTTFFDINSIKAKMLCISNENDFLHIPLLHTLEILNK